MIVALFLPPQQEDELSFEHVASKTVTEIHELGRKKHVSFESAAAVHDDQRETPK